MLGFFFFNPVSCIRNFCQKHKITMYIQDIQLPIWFDVPTFTEGCWHIFLSFQQSMLPLNSPVESSRDFSFFPQLFQADSLKHRYSLGLMANSDFSLEPCDFQAWWNLLCAMQRPIDYKGSRWNLVFWLFRYLPILPLSHQSLWYL